MREKALLLLGFTVNARGYRLVEDMRESLLVLLLSGTNAVMFYSESSEKNSENPQFLIKVCP
jgi:hypothetical protein